MGFFPRYTFLFLGPDWNMGPTTSFSRHLGGDVEMMMHRTGQFWGLDLVQVDGERCGLMTDDSTNYKFDI